MSESSSSQRLPDMTQTAVHGASVSPTMLQREGMQALADRIHGMTKGGGRTVIRIQGWWRHQLHWGQSHLSGSSELRDYSVVIERTVGGGTAVRSTNQITDEALAETVRLVELAASGATKHVWVPTMSVPGKPQTTPTPAIWSDRSAALTAEERAKVGAAIATACQQRDVTSSGVLELRGHEQMGFTYGSVTGEFAPAKDVGALNAPSAPNDDNTHDADETETEDSVSVDTQRGYVRYTLAFCRMRAYDRDGAGSGWAGASNYDWGAFDTKTLVDQAIERCLSSRNPIRIEPGRYPVVLDPQAVVVLASLLVNTSKALDRTLAESNRSAFTQSPDQQLQLYRTKLGMKVIDERITIRHDPLDPRLGVIPTAGLRPVTWIDKGKLINLNYSHTYAVQMLQENTENDARPSFILEGGSDESLDDIIANTPKGILITRLNNARLLSTKLLLATGEATDLWQIEDGKITRAVSPMRFTDSPLLAFNAVDRIGASVPTFAVPQQGVMPMIVPPMSIREFALPATTTSQL